MTLIQTKKPASAALFSFNRRGISNDRVCFYSAMCVLLLLLLLLLLLSLNSCVWPFLLDAGRFLSTEEGEEEEVGRRAAQRRRKRKEKKIVELIGSKRREQQAVTQWVGTHTIFIDLHAALNVSYYM
jgi:hypothetical protein